MAGLNAATDGMAQPGRLKDEAMAQRRRGRLQERYWRVAAAFEIQIAKRKQPKSEPSKGKQSKDKACLSITWHRRQSWSDWAALSEGCYLLWTHLTETDPATLWKQYIQLTEAEWAVRVEKGGLGIRPIGHQKENRVLGHMLVCFPARAFSVIVYRHFGQIPREKQTWDRYRKIELALMYLWKALAPWMRSAGLGDAPRMLIEEFAKIKSGDVVLPAQMADQPRICCHAGSPSFWGVHPCRHGIHAAPA